MVKKIVVSWFAAGAAFLLLVVILMVVLAGQLLTNGGGSSPINGTITNAGGIPGEFLGLIIQGAKDGGCAEVTPALLAAQLHQESGFNPTATSPVGAQGIAQFMPATWAAVGQGNPLDPADAIPAAARYDCALAAELADVPGDPVANMLAGYNAGAGAVQANAGIPPYLETQNYVRAITSQAAVYAQDLSAGGPVNTGQIAPVLAFVRSQLGKPYVWGATGPDAWDCSSLMQAAYARIGIQLHRTTFEQVNDGARVSATNLQPGDLLFIAGSDGTDTAPGHVGMYMGNGEIIHAKGARWGVVDDALANWTDISIVVRPLARAGT